MASQYQEGLPEVRPLVGHFVGDLLRRHFNLQVTQGGLAHLLPAYAELCEQVGNAPAVTPDETGWCVGTLRQWLWAFVTPDTRA